MSQTHDDDGPAGRLRLAHIPGDGVGAEVTGAALPLLAGAAAIAGTTIEVVELPWGGQHYLDTGMMMPADGIEQLRAFDAIFFGAFGRADVPDDVAAWGLRLGICQGLDQYVSARPAWSVPGVVGPLGERAFDLVVVRENSEGEFLGAGGRLHRGLPAEAATETAVFTRAGVERVAEHALALAQRRRGRLTSVTKSNVQRHTMGLWDEVVAQAAARHPDVELESLYVDAVGARLVLEPERFDVLLCSNAHGDILSDLTGALMGSLGMAGSANLDPTGAAPSMFEPIHGSAPDIAGTGRANPVGAIRSVALLLEHVGLSESAAVVSAALDATLAAGIRTPDVGGTATTEAVAAAVLERFA
jgi:tartrate dehydrogenase/decarboxylase/D-malate dehydrogenase